MPLSTAINYVESFFHVKTFICWRHFSRRLLLYHGTTPQLSSESFFFSRSGITDTYFTSLFLLFVQFIRSLVKVWLSGLRVTLFKFQLGSKGSGNQAAVLVREQFSNITEPSHHTHALTDVLFIFI